MLSKLKSVIKTPEIEFLCYKEDVGVIPEPYPARKYMPRWFKKLPQRIEKKNTLNNATLKRCAPFIDAMSVGWILPLAADVDIQTNDDASGVTYSSNFHRNIIENHAMEQISTDEAPNPMFPKPPMKFLNWWAIRVPKDYSILFIPPINRPEPRFTCFSGFVECDRYFQFINFPFVFNIKNYTGIIKAGTPLMQVIPIRRDTLIKETTIRGFNDDDYADLEKSVHRKNSQESYYRDQLWSPK